MAIIHSRSFRLIWAIWILILGLSLLFVHSINYVSSFSQYLGAFLALDMPSSWCPTFLILYGFAALIAYLLGDSGLKKAFTLVSVFAGLILLPIGVYATYTFTLEQSVIDFIYVYAQAIHMSEILTGVFTLILLARPKG